MRYKCVWARVQEEWEKGEVHMAGELGKVHTKGSVNEVGRGEW